MPETNYALWQPSEGLAGGFGPIDRTSPWARCLSMSQATPLRLTWSMLRLWWATVLRAKTAIPNICW